MKLIQSMILAVAALGGLLRREIAAANTYDAAVETHEFTIFKTNDVAVATRHLLWATGAAAGGVAINTASTVPMGTIDNIETGTAVRQTLHLLGKGSTKKMVANEIITEGERVFGAAAGKVQDLPAGAGTYYCVGIALTGSGADGDVIEVLDCVPFSVVVP